MSIIKTSNIPTFVLDDINQGFCNLYPLYKNESTRSLTEPWSVPRWLDHFNIDYNIRSVDQASSGDWYPISINFWDFEQNYLTAMSKHPLDLVCQGRLRVLFYYREADDPARIRKHINQMCEPLGIDPGSILLISGNTHADSLDGCSFFWHFDVDYYFRCLGSEMPKINEQTRTRKVTCLSRVNKNWREWFVYNLTRYSQQDYISYGTVDTSEFHKADDFVLWHDSNLHLTGIGPLDIQAPNDQWQRSLPIKADDLTADQHNDHSIVIENFFQDSYWNIVLETLLDTENSPGVFVTEKTLKPIRNGQSFVVLGCENSLEFLRTNGYKTFSNTLDESYDTIKDIRQRWYRIFEIAKYLATSDFHNLDRLQRQNVPVIQHNIDHFQRSRRPMLNDFINILCH